MAIQHFHAVYTVSGEGPFPLSMLTEERAWPYSRDDALAIAVSWTSILSGELVEGSTTSSIRLRGTYTPSHRRWNALGWIVSDMVEVPIVTASTTE